MSQVLILEVICISCKNVVKYDIIKYCTERVVNLWNSLPSLVVEAPSLKNCFQMQLDKFWSNKDVLYDLKRHSWESEVEGIRCVMYRLLCYV